MLVWKFQTLLVVTISGFVAGLASAFSPNYYVMLVFRWLIGFGYSGSFLAAPYCLEFLPARSRAVVVCLLEAAWATGSVLEVLLALVVMTSIEYQPWRWLLGFSALPTLVVIALFILAPESPMYLITRGKHSKAKKVLSLIAKMNCKQLPVGRLVTAEEKEQMRKETSPPLNDIAAVSTVAAMKDINDELKCEMNEDISNGTLPNMDNRTVPNMDNDDLTMISSDNESDSELLLDEHTHGRKQIINKLANYYHWILILFKNGWWRTTLLLWYLWFATNIMYYGGALLTTALFQHDEHCGLNQNNTTDDDCKELTKSDYVRLVWTTCAEFPGIIWIIVLLLVIGRKRSLALTAFAAAVCYGLLFLCLNETILTVFLFGVRGFATGFFQGIYVYTPEVYPTTVRAFGVSLCASVSRLGSMIAPYIAQTLLAYSSIATISLFIVFSLLSSVASLLLPIETRGRPMKDTGG
ncbi:synaptic vesicle 2-related protein-like isoform X2 [Dysidea avara]|uniref:synaptic vesicle 2-related protein-like isoform X2 n=1 Tax=Dysidea avara TaxID=196820 RepID=UPI00331FB96D